MAASALSGRSALDPRATHAVSVCLACGCDDNHACVTNGMPCSWSVQFGDGTGVCNACVRPEGGAEARQPRHSSPRLGAGVAALRRG